MWSAFSDIYGNGEECEEEEVKCRISDVGEKRLRILDFEYRIGMMKNGFCPYFTEPVRSLLPVQLRRQDLEKKISNRIFETCQGTTEGKKYQENDG